MDTWNVAKKVIQVKLLLLHRSSMVSTLESITGMPQAKFLNKEKILL